MTVAPTAAHGATIALLTETDPEEVFEDIVGIHNGPNGPGFQPVLITGRHHASSDNVVKMSQVDKTPVTFDIYYDSSDSIHAALLTAAKTGAKCTFLETLTDTGADSFRYDAFVGMAPAAPVDGFNVMSVTLTIDGAITEA